MQLLIGVDICFFRVDAGQLVNSKMDIKLLRQILTCDILEPQRRYAAIVSCCARRSPLFFVRFQCWFFFLKRSLVDYFCIVFLISHIFSMIWQILLCPANYCVQPTTVSKTLLCPHLLCVNTCPDVPQFNLLQLYRAALGMAAFINCVRQVHIRSKMATFRKHSLTLDPIGNAFKDLLHWNYSAIKTKLGHNGPWIVHCLCTVCLSYLVFSNKT